MFEGITPDTILRRMVSELDTGLVDPEGSYVGDLLGAAALEIFRVYQTLNALEPMFYVSAASGPYIDKMCAVFGLSRKPGARASCTVTLTGTDGATIPAGTVLLTADGLPFALDAAVILTGGSGSGTATAAAEGAAYNSPGGALIRPQSSVYALRGIQSGAASGGADAESDAALAARLRAALSTPAAAANGYQYQAWATSVPGVGAARVIGLWGGAGTVKIILASDTMGAVDAQTIAAVEQVIEDQAMIGPTVTVVSAEETAVSVAATLSLAAGVDVDAVRAQFTAALTAYLSTLAMTGFGAYYNAEMDTPAGIKISYHMVAALLMACTGVLDFTGLQLNGDTDNLTLGAADVPVLGTVMLTCGT